jgi:hypothetical protein
LTGAAEAAVDVSPGFGERVGEGFLARALPDHVGEEGAEGLPRVVHRGQCGGAVGDALQPSLEHRLEQRFLGREVPEQGADPHPGGAGHLLGRRRGAFVGEHPLGRLEQLLAVAGSVSAQRRASPLLNGVETPYSFRSEHSE